MKKIKLLIILFICLFIANIKADMGAPTVAPHDVIVTNKNGAQCYEYNGKKEDTIIPYQTTLEVYSDIEGSYIHVSSDESKYNCYVKYSDVSAKTQNFNLNGENVDKITSKKAIILAKGGLNMRKGPSVTYSRIMTIPQYSVVTLTYSSGTYWYYATYNDKSGWITSMDNYIGFEGKEVLINNEPVNIYDMNGKAVLGKIPANTEISNYIELPDGSYYVIYNNIKGCVSGMFYKINSPGKIKLLKDYEIQDNNGKATKKITKGQELEYTMVTTYNGFYIPDKKVILDLADGEFEYITKAKISTKKSGYLGEGLFGEEKQVREDIKDEEEEKEEIKEEIETKKKNNTEIIIIALLAGIFIALTALVIIKLINNRKKNVATLKPKEEPVIEKKPDDEIEKARKVIAERINSETRDENNNIENDNNKEV